MIDIEELNRLAYFLGEVAENWGLTRDLLLKINLVSEEVISNIILYGYEKINPLEVIHYTIQMEDNRITICITDNGMEFDPLSAPIPDDLDKPASERKIGGLGVYFIRQLMDEVTYKYEQGQNILCLKKNIS